MNKTCLLVLREGLLPLSAKLISRASFSTPRGIDASISRLQL